MKLNKIFMALAAMAIVGCSSDDLSVVAPGQQAAEDSQLIELNPNFVIAGVGAEDNGTRTHWKQNTTTKALYNEFLPIYNVTGTSVPLNTIVDLEAQAVGLCWLGNGAVSSDVYTNYQFYHFGWLNVGETEADIEDCPPYGKIYNGALYSDITANSSGVGNEAAPATDFTAFPSTVSAAGLNYNSGVYRTDNKSIFGGDYIVYYPFDVTFENAGTIPAKAKLTWDDVPTDFTSPELGHETFRYSSKVTIDGGDKAADFGLYNLSSLVQLRVALPADATASTHTISKVILYSTSGKLLEQANLAADKILAGKKGTELYADKKGTKTIVANFSAGAYPTLVATNSTTPVPTSAYVTVLPTTVDDLVALVYSPTMNKWARVTMPTTTFEAGKAKRLDISVTVDDFKSDFIAVDEASLAQALSDARATITSPTAKATIEVIGDITLTGTVTSPVNPTLINNAKDLQITIKGGDIIVPENVTFTVATNMESKVRVLGKECCSAATVTGGRFVVQGGTINDVTMEPTVARVTAATYDQFNPEVSYTTSTATIAAGKTVDVKAGNVKVNAAVQHKGGINIAEGAKLTVSGTGDLNFMGSTVVNDGTIEVLKAGKYDMTDANGNATATDGQRMTNNGKFIHNVDAGVGTAVQKMHQNGEYRCRVDAQKKLDDAFLQWTACSVIEMVNTAGYTYNLGTAKGITPAAYKHNGKFIDIEVNAGGITTFDNPVVGATTDGDNEIIQIGNLTVEKGGLYVDFVTGKGQRTLEVNGDMAVKAANSRLVSSKKIDVKGNLTVDGATTQLQYRGKKSNGGFAVAKDITVSGGATFDAGSGLWYVDALNITCANFYLKSGATAIFGNRTDGAAKNLTVSGTIDNGAGCTFNIVAADQDGAGSVLAWVSCQTLIATGNFPGPKPRVE